MRKSRKFEIIEISKSDREVVFVMTCTTKKDMDDHALRDLINRELKKKVDTKNDHAYRILR